MKKFFCPDAGQTLYVKCNICGKASDCMFDCPYEYCQWFSDSWDENRCHELAEESRTRGVNGGSQVNRFFSSLGLHVGTCFVNMVLFVSCCAAVAPDDPAL